MNIGRASFNCQYQIINLDVQNFKIIKNTHIPGLLTNFILLEYKHLNKK